MKQYIITLATLLLMILSAKAQKITVVDTDGKGFFHCVAPLKA